MRDLLAAGEAAGDHEGLRRRAADGREQDLLAIRQSFASGPM
ncbi:MAG TPA: hypothetical protein VD695_05985 [Gaiellaceae bacterium]|nr:hypothetical protein [Gaiellaceae bacterium]